MTGLEGRGKYGKDFRILGNPVEYNLAGSVENHYNDGFFYLVHSLLL
jgi:hypothetical protein